METALCVMGVQASQRYNTPSMPRFGMSLVT